MKIAFLSFCALLLTTVQVFGQEDVPAQKPPETLMDKFAYGIGLGLGRKLAADDIKLNLNWLLKGVEDGVNEVEKPLLSDEEYQATMTAVQQQLQAQQGEKLAEVAKANKAIGDAFLADNAKKQGVVTTKTGLQYQLLKRGTGAASPKATDTVKVHYHGTLLDGKVFDSSVDRGAPFECAVNEVIPGWTEALQLMKVGDKLRLFIPSNLAYGPRGAGGDIGPNAALVFEVELLEIAK